MNTITIAELKTDTSFEYKKFFTDGLINDEDNFRMTVADDNDTTFPTKDTEDSFTLGAYINNQLAGVVSFAREGADREKMRHKGLLFRMLVSKEFRGCGVGKKLMEASIERVKHIETIEQVNLTVIATNSVAKALYKKFGFVTFSVEHHATKWKGKYFTEEQMVLMLK